MGKPYRRITSCERLTESELQGWGHNFTILYGTVRYKDEGEMGMRLMTDWLEYRDFIERLARTELVREFRDESLTAMWVCPRCAGDAQDYFCRERFVHMPSCPVLESRQLLGLAMDKRGISR